MKAHEIFLAMVTDWPGVCKSPAYAKAIMFSGREFPGFTGLLMRQILLCNGDWRKAVADILAGRNASPALPRERVLAFQKWAEKITARPIRGLLEWKGGAA